MSVRARRAARVALFVLLPFAATAFLLLARGVAEAGESGGFGDPSGTATTVAPEAHAELVTAGKQLFLTSCVSCHGVDGIGTANGPNIQNAGEASADFYLRTGRMPLAAPTPQPPDKPVAYTDEEIRQLVAYVGSLGQGPPIPPIDVSRGDIQRGAQLFLENCAACHNSSAIGGAISDGRYAPSLQETHPVQIGEAPRIGPGEMPVFGTDVLSPEDLNDIVTYVDYLHRPDHPGGLDLGYTGPVAEGFVALLFGLGALVLVIRWITSESAVGQVRVRRAKVAHPAAPSPTRTPDDGGSAP